MEILEHFWVSSMPEGAFNSNIIQFNSNMCQFNFKIIQFNSDST